MREMPIPNCEQLKEIAQKIISRRGEYGKECLVIFCRHLPKRDSREHIVNAREIGVNLNMYWYFLLIMNWCVRFISGEGVEDKTDMILDLGRDDPTIEHGTDEITLTKINLIDGILNIAHWFRPIIKQVDAKHAEVMDSEV